MGLTYILYGSTKGSLIYILFLSLWNYYLSYITSQIFLVCSYQCLFLLLDKTLIYHKISYMDSYLDSMERENEGGSPSFIRHRANRSYEMQNEYLLNRKELLEDQMFVYLYDIHGKQVGKRLLQDMVVGDILYDKPISLDDAMVFIQGIIIPETRVHELNLTFMSDCLHKFIRWPRSQIKLFQLPTTPNLHLPHIHCIPSPLMSQMSNIFIYDHLSFEHTMEGLPESHVRCKKQCLQNIDKHDILSLRYQTLDMTKYKGTTCWILTTLRGFRVSYLIVPMEMKFKARIVGQKLCIACFANAVGYSLRRLNFILSEIREIDVIDVFHGHCEKKKNYS